MLLHVIGWGLTCIALVGAACNIKKKRVCFFLWAFSNLGWCAIDIIYGIYSQAFLQGIFFCLSLWGIYEWSKEKTNG